MKKEYFSGSDQIIFRTAHSYIVTYNQLPTEETLAVIVNEIPGYTDDQVKEACETLEAFEKEAADTNIDWLIDVTRIYIRDKAIENGMREALTILNEPKKSKKTKEAIPTILQDALAVDLDIVLGHDYIEDAELRWEEMHKPTRKIPFSLDKMNEILKGGMPDKKMLVYVAGINVGKSLCMCSDAAHFLSIGKNVVYFTLEMSEIDISQRIDANLMNIVCDDVEALPKEDYLRLAKKLKQKTTGKLVIKEYATGTATSSTFRGFLNELKLKRNGFIPDVIFVDYINNTASANALGSASLSNSYGYVKKVTEELRAIAVDYQTRIISATQFNREGFGSSDPDMDNTAESFGLPATVDYMIGIMTDENLAKAGQYIFKQIKNRHGSKMKIRRFVVGVDYDKMRLYNVNASVPSKNGEGDDNETPSSPPSPPRKKSFTDKFKGLKT